MRATLLFHRLSLYFQGHYETKIFEIRVMKTYPNTCIRMIRGKMQRTLSILSSCISSILHRGLSPTRKLLGYTGVLLLFAVSSCSGVVHADQNDASQARTRNDGKKWRIGYYESGPFPDFASTLRAIVISLGEKGWLEGMEGLPPENQVDARLIWNWLASHKVGPYLEFVKDAFYSSNFEKETRVVTKEKLVDRLSKNKDIDLMIAMGTWAGQDLANDLHSTPTLVFSAGDAVRAGIAASAEDSGRDHIWAHVDPVRYRIQLELFHDLFKFQTLGIVYENSDAGRIYAAIMDVEAVAQSLGFEIVPCFITDNTSSKEQVYEDLLGCYQSFGTQVDAVYLTLHPSLRIIRLPKLLETLYGKKIPTFSQQGVEDVKYGALMSLSRADFRGEGNFGAQAIARVLQGELPRRVSQVFVNPPSLMINLEAASKIGYTPPFDILITADKVFTDTAIP